jgi:transcriptional regulator with XRE-family HTH domain
VAKRDEIRDFLTTRRARVTPEEAGLPAFGDNRRVPGLRREEVAMLAGVSVDYYIRLERGDAPGASEEVLDGLARALRLDQAERTHLHDLFRNVEPPAPIEREAGVRPAVKRVVDAMVGMPTMVRSRRLDILYANELGAALYSGVYDMGDRPPGPARYVFFDQASRVFFVDWERAAGDMVGLLRAEAGRNPTDYALTELIDELSEGSDEFRGRWDAHDVLFHRTGVAHFQHPEVGGLTLTYEDLVLPEDPGQTILVFTAEPGSESEEAVRSLAAWPSGQHPIHGNRPA